MIKHCLFVLVSISVQDRVIDDFQLFGLYFFAVNQEDNFVNARIHFSA
jgi:hypothetical protein